MLLSLGNAGFFAVGAVVICMGLLFGGVAQIMAGIMEYKNGNTFGMTIFCSFGFFWIVVIAIMLGPNLGLGKESASAMAWMFFLWGIYSSYLLIGTLRTNRMMQMTVTALTLVLFLLAASYAYDNSDLQILAGYVGLIAGAGAVYMAASQTLMETLGKDVLPVFPVDKKGQ